MTSYDAIHKYLAYHYPKTGRCDFCEQQRRTQFALLHGRPLSRHRVDYLELCASCHSRYDHGGERNSAAKLSMEQVAKIRRLYQPSKGGRNSATSTRALASQFGVSHTTIRRIVTGRKWVPADGRA